MAYDTRIQNSGGGDFDTATSHKVMVNSRGFAGEYRRSYCGFSAAPIAQDEKGRMQRNYWYSSCADDGKARVARGDRANCGAADAAAAGGSAGEDAEGAGSVFTGDRAGDHRQHLRGGQWRRDLSPRDVFRRDAGGAGGAGEHHRGGRRHDGVRGSEVRGHWRIWDDALRRRGPCRRGEPFWSSAAS